MIIISFTVSQCSFLPLERHFVKYYVCNFATIQSDIAFIVVVGNCLFIVHNIFILSHIPITFKLPDNLTDFLSGLVQSELTIFKIEIKSNRFISSPYDLLLSI